MTRILEFDEDLGGTFALDASDFNRSRDFTIEPFHLPGQHNQKTHGRKTAHRRWRTVPRSEGMRTEVDRVRAGMPDISPEFAKQLVGERFASATFLRQGEHQITIEHPSDVDKHGLEIALDTFSHLIATYPPPGPMRIHIGVADFYGESDVTGGISIAGTGDTSINMFALDPDTQVSEGWHKEKYMPVAQTSDHDDMVRYIVTHEYGHTITPTFTDSNGYPVGYFESVRWNWNLYKRHFGWYGQQHHAEALAEAFAEYDLSNGETDNVAAQHYAYEYNWRGKRDQ